MHSRRIRAVVEIHATSSHAIASSFPCAPFYQFGIDMHVFILSKIEEAIISATLQGSEDFAAHIIE